MKNKIFFLFLLTALSIKTYAMTWFEANFASIDIPAYFVEGSYDMFQSEENIHYFSCQDVQNRLLPQGEKLIEDSTYLCFSVGKFDVYSKYLGVLFYQVRYVMTPQNRKLYSIQLRLSIIDKHTEKVVSSIPIVCTSLTKNAFTYYSDSVFANLQTEFIEYYSTIFEGRDKKIHILLQMDYFGKYEFRITKNGTLEIVPSRHNILVR